jgi:hypothetical protein
MLLIASLVLVFGALFVFIGNVIASEGGELGPLFEQMIHARIPWLLIAIAVGGAGLGIWSLVRSRRWYKWVVVPVEVVLAGFLATYFLSLSWLPEHALAVEVGEPFPAYTLVDQDGGVQAAEAGTARRPALYVFYRGDW